MNDASTENLILISGAGIAGLALGLTLHQLGISFKIFEAAKEIKPLGVGVNIQPNAVRELFELGITESDLDNIGVKTKEWALLGLNGNEIYSEPRGRFAGYIWPQYSVHRGKLQVLLLQKILERAGQECILTGCNIVGYQKQDSSVKVKIIKRNGDKESAQGSILVGADGLHSRIRAQMYPMQPPVHWGGAIMWRGVSWAKPVRTEASFIGIGTDKKRVVLYPISSPCIKSGYALINWIAEVTRDNIEGQDFGDWNKSVDIDSFVHNFENWRYDWLDIPSLLKKADTAYEFPMIDRDPIPTWVDEKVVLIGDAAHVMYPTGSNGATQAIIDARELGSAFLKNGVGELALECFDNKLCKPVSNLILRNRNAGPFGILKIIDERCGGIFENIEDVMPKSELSDFMASYKAHAGFDIQHLNSSMPVIDQLN